MMNKDSKKTKQGEDNPASARSASDGGAAAAAAFAATGGAAAAAGAGTTSFSSSLFNQLGVKEQALFLAMDAISIEDKIAFNEAIQIAPELVLSESPMEKFLQVDDFDAKAAAIRLVKYWQFRRNIFGSKDAYRPMKNGALNDPVDLILLQRAVISQLPSDDEGHPVLLIDPSRLFGVQNIPFATPIGKHRDRVLFYLLHDIAMTDEEPARGMVVVRPIHATKFNAKQFQNTVQMIHAMPIKISKYHFCCSPSPEEKHHVILTLTPKLNEALREELGVEGGRVAMHMGEPKSLLLSLQKCGFSKLGLPSNLGGSWSPPSLQLMVPEDNDVVSSSDQNSDVDAEELERLSNENEMLKVMLEKLRSATVEAPAPQTSSTGSQEGGSGDNSNATTRMDEGDANQSPATTTEFEDAILNAFLMMMQGQGQPSHWQQQDNAMVEVLRQLLQQQQPPTPAAQGGDAANLGGSSATITTTTISNDEGLQQQQHQQTGEGSDSNNNLSSLFSTSQLADLEFLLQTLTRLSGEGGMDTVNATLLQNFVVFGGETQQQQDSGQNNQDAETAANVGDTAATNAGGGATHQLTEEEQLNIIQQLLQNAGSVGQQQPQQQQFQQAAPVTQTVSNQSETVAMQNQLHATQAPAPSTAGVDQATMAAAMLQNQPPELLNQLLFQNLSGAAPTPATYMDHGSGGGANTGGQNMQQSNETAGFPHQDQQSYRQVPLDESVAAAALLLQQQDPQILYQLLQGAGGASDNNGMGGWMNMRSEDSVERLRKIQRSEQ